MKSLEKEREEFILLSSEIPGILVTSVFSNLGIVANLEVGMAPMPFLCNGLLLNQLNLPGGNKGFTFKIRKIQKRVGPLVGQPLHILVTMLFPGSNLRSCFYKYANPGLRVSSLVVIGGVLSIRT